VMSKKKKAMSARARSQVEYHVTRVNGTHWKDPGFPSDPDNWVYAPMVRAASTACFQTVIRQ